MVGKFPITPWSDAFDGLPWLQEMWSNYDDLCNFWETVEELPKPIEGDDIFQDLVSYFIVNGVPNKFEIGYAARAGLLWAMKHVMLERGRAVESEDFIELDPETDELVMSDRRVIPRVFITVDSDAIEIQMNGDLTYVERQVASANELALRLEPLNDIERQVLYDTHVGGFSSREIAHARGTSKSYIGNVLREAIRKAKEVQIDGT